MRRALAALAVVSLVAAACVSSQPSAADCQPGPTYTRDPAPLDMEPVAAAMGQPAWTIESEEATFSSPSLADLNGDGVLDVVQGFGQDTLGDRMSSVLATDGATGNELWRSSGHEDLIGTARFLQLGGDAVADVVIGGRRGALLGINGSTGEVLWTFDEQNGRWFNFYTAQIIDDQNGDGVEDLVAANGGLVFDEPAEVGVGPDPEKRNLGTTFVVSGSDGSVIARLPAPDRREQYMSPLVIPPGGSDDGAGQNVIIGTGGETLPGSVWRLPLDALVNEDPAASIEVVSGGDKGVIATPSMADLTGDCVLDFVVQSFGGTVTAVDGSSTAPIWTVPNPGFETYSTPTLGYFVGDDSIADVFVAMARGVWPEYDSSDYLLIDGSSGAVMWRQTMGTFAPSGFVAADVNGDGRDEVIFGVNDLEQNSHQLHILDTTRLTMAPLGPALPQTTFSSPWLGDIDNDGLLDLLATESAYQSSGPARVHRFNLPWPTPKLVSWGGYLGTSTNGVIESWM